MTKRKTRRSRCASDTCGKQFRHADPSAATCSPACRQRESRKERKAKQERERREKYQRMAAVFLKRTALAKAEQDAAERSATARHVAKHAKPHGTCTTWLTPTSWGAVVFTSWVGTMQPARSSEPSHLQGLCWCSQPRARAARLYGSADSGPLGTRAPEAGVITITMPKAPYRR